jgi:hypothetical protein
MRLLAMAFHSLLQDFAADSDNRTTNPVISMIISTAPPKIYKP